MDKILFFSQHHLTTVPLQARTTARGILVQTDGLPTEGGMHKVVAFPRVGTVFYQYNSARGMAACCYFHKIMNGGRGFTAPLVLVHVQRTGEKA